MDISLDLAGRRVLVFGGALAARRVLARFLAAEAIVYLASVTVDVQLATGHGDHSNPIADVGDREV
ncbi:hypothetical protein QN345_18475, partial [Cryobacterium sp. 10I1]|uniref:hypothetical protein n=1 Tax=Cryobacterium sp. 10I1 TaxID=3048578 RepID=UPI002B23AF18